MRCLGDGGVSTAVSSRFSFPPPLTGVSWLPEESQPVAASSGPAPAPSNPEHAQMRREEAAYASAAAAQDIRLRALKKRLPPYPSSH